MGFVLKYVLQIEGRYVFRRVVPETLRSAVGKREIKIPLGTTEKQMLQRYEAARKLADDLLRAAEEIGQSKEQEPSLHTALEHYEAAQRRIVEMGWSEDQQFADETELEHRQLSADIELEKYHRDEKGNYIGVPDDESAYIRALLGAKKPAPTLLDAKRLYVKDKITGKPNERNNLLRLERGLGVLQDIVGEDPQLSQIKRLHARCWIDYLTEQGKSAQNIRRMLAPIKAMLNHAELELELNGYKNPFQRLALPEADYTQREALPQSVLETVRSEIAAKGEGDLLSIWLLLEWSGARLAEVSGLKATDLQLDADVPHMVIEPHELRPIKTKSSWRKTPLDGFGLKVAEEALVGAKGHEGLFPRFHKTRGSDGASQRLMRIIRNHTDDPRHVVHSLRHGVKDRLRLAGVPKEVQDMILGHAKMSVGEGYGSERVRLQVMRDALVRAHSLDVPAV